MVGIVDPDATRANTVLDTKRASLAGQAYASAKVWPSISAVSSDLKLSPPDLIIVGSPPAFRGRFSNERNLDAERQLSDAFPKAALFVEKPISTGPVDETRRVAELLESRENIVSVGYMLRYSAAVQKMKQILRENDLKVMMTSARYVMGE